MHITLLTLEIAIPGCASLKEKRSRLKPLLARLRREFNVSTAEVGLQDRWGEAQIACVIVSASAANNQRTLQQAARWIEQHWPDLDLVDERIETI